MAKTFIIAEAGVNHNGELKIAKQLVDLAIECKADVVKFQIFKAYESHGTFAGRMNSRKKDAFLKENQLENVKKLELPFEDFLKIKSYCDKKGIIFIATPDGIESLKFLLSLDIPFIKVGSTDVTHLEFLKEIGHAKKPIVLSTGMSTLGEVETALNVIYSTGNRQVKLLHCTTSYPAALGEVNLKAMVTLRETFKVPVGLSDHTIGYEAAIAAVSLGAEIIEKHITLDRNMQGPDHQASLPQEEFKKYVQFIRNTETLLGDGVKIPTKSETEIAAQVRRSIVAAGDLRAGTILTKEMFAFKRPGWGLRPEFIYLLEGRILKRDLRRDEPILWEDM